MSFLIDRLNAITVRFCSKKVLRAELEGLFVNGHVTIASDGHLLIKVATPGADKDREAQATANEEAVIIPAEACENVIRFLPTERTPPAVVTTIEDGRIQISLPGQFVRSEIAIKAKAIEDQFLYANIDSVFPKSPPQQTICIDARLLRSLAEFFAKYCYSQELIVELRGSQSPVVIKGEIKGSDRKVVALLMPSVSHPQMPAVSIP